MTPRSVLAWRYVTGRPLDGRANHPYLSRGAGRWPGWKRQVVRLTVPAASVAAMVEPQTAGQVGMALGVVAVDQARRRWKRRRFRREYVSPTLAAVRVPLGLAEVHLHVSPELGNLTPRLAKPLSPAEEHVRRLYGTRVEPVLRWPVDMAMQAWWAVQLAAEPLTRHLTVFRRPGEKPGPRIELTAGVPYLTAEQRNLVSAIIHSKIPVADLVESWDQVGRGVTATWTVRRRPPAKVGYDEVIEALPTLAEWEFYLGAGAGNLPVTLSLRDDSPHIAVSAGTGAGKSVFAQLIAVQVLARGGRVVILDRKGSHRWAIDVIGVDYCTQPNQMHNALLSLAAMADRRNTQAFREADDWNPGPRYLVICEELNATIGQLANFWAGVREKSDPKKSPAIAALADLLFMGRSAKVNVLAIAQMLTARAIGGPEARENFGIRCLARYTANAWKMLVPEAAMPRASRTLGRWQVVIGGVATEVQVAYLTGAQARAIASRATDVTEVPDSALTSNVPGDQGHSTLMTLREACDEGVLPWRYDAAKKRLQRGVGKPPKPRGKRGAADLFARADLTDWASR